MEQIIIQVRNKDKAKILLEMLNALDFVESVNASEIETEDSSMEESEDFFSFAGLWQDRDITLESIRQKAWPRQLL